ncbi:hypothetical protein B0T26DRAFT_659831 [Lasiosphaeria miniovina]|uniref:Oxidoreductase n=1 Tax=Lasiosphaeria miniovina TaxID=1954250 RepID=A0AA40DJD2_9PEZI|nr:uncharacterized protein B0T26DRAFT_659831 [Lasiosphaeria miniovina]KAK0702078.1 hypothetical protein B0T26DRAFT_659831 [Lasiosphaeria miniovina]
MASAYHLPSDAVWFITGCSSGIGQALAAHVGAEGYRVVATARKVTSLDYLVAADDTKILKLALDVTSRPSIDAAVAAALARFGRIDVLVNNAGYTLIGDTENAADGDARRLLDTNFWGVVDLTKTALRVMRDDNSALGGKQGGVIINVTSMGGRVGYPSQAFYHASKFAVEGFTESVAREVRPEWGLHFCLVEPGGVRTNYAGSSMQRIAPPHPAYAAADSPSRVLEAYIADPASTRNWAEPASVAAALLELVAAGKPIPLRLPLGPDSWGALREDVKRKLRELDEVKDVALSVGHQAQAESIAFLSEGR